MIFVAVMTRLTGSGYLKYTLSLSQFLFQDLMNEICNSVVYILAVVHGKRMLYPKVKGRIRKEGIIMS